ncbi:MAG TPA: Shedu anti-phage system protein SduA domain-containing protein [Candidatus Elarobacter sp.]|nr:Shedu anti-phage system protein SduA domain-containing protein [Candidatus Elarobacter sp.]
MGAEFSELVYEAFSAGSEFGLESTFTEEIRALPRWCAMPDGRRWSGIPIVVVLHHNSAPETSNNIGYFSARDPSQNCMLFETVQAAVRDYQQRLLAEFDNLGFLISEEHGRFRLGPALARSDAESELYHGPADRRSNERWVTVSRDLVGVTYEVELFEALINRQHVLEAELQQFFEQHPHFLTMNAWSAAIPHPRFTRETGEILIPDFVLEPIIAERALARGSSWQILELKRPDDVVLVGPERRRRLSAQVHTALAQLREYRGFFENPAHTAEVAGVLGVPVRRPQMAVLIGRLRDGEDLDALDAEQERENVRVVTYDEILDRQRALVDPPRRRP